MKRVYKSFLTFAVATAMVGIAVTQARADRITLKSGCAGVSCNPETLTVNSGSLSLGMPSLAVDTDTANSAALELATNMAGHNDSPAVESAKSATSESSATLAVRNDARPAVALLSNSMLWSFSGTHSSMHPTLSSASLALPIATRNSGSFSVAVANVANAPSISSAAAKAGKTFQAKSGDPQGIPGGAPVPEPTTMLLFGSGLVGVAAVLRKRLKGRRAETK